MKTKKTKERKPLFFQERLTCLKGSLRGHLTEGLMNLGMTSSGQTAKTDAKPSAYSLFFTFSLS